MKKQEEYINLLAKFKKGWYMHDMEIRHYEAVSSYMKVAGVSGKISQNRIRPSDILRNSVLILLRQTGSQQQLQLWMIRSFRISQIFANVTRELVRLLQVVLSAARIPAGY